CVYTGHQLNPPRAKRPPHFPWSAAAGAGAFGSGGAFQTLTVPSRLAEAIHWPSGLKATAWTQLVWPRRTWVSVPGPSQTLTVLSVLPQASRRRSRPNATHWAAAPVESCRSWRSFQVSVSQTLTVRSQLAEASAFPSRLNATLATRAACRGSRTGSGCP